MRLDQHHDVFHGTVATQPSEEAPRADRIAARVAVGRALPDAVLREWRRGVPLVVVFSVPGPAWCQAVAEELKLVLEVDKSVEFDGARAYLTAREKLAFVRDGSERTQGKRDVSARHLPAHLGRGGSVMAVAADVSLLPAEVTAAADHVIDVRPLAAADLRRIVREVTDSGRRVRVDDGLAAAATPEDLAASVRPRSSPADCVSRLRRRIEVRSVSAVAVEVPRLEDLPGYGEAHAWGMRLVRDVAERRAAGDQPLARITRSLLLSGPPGVGKTLFARALARSAGIPIIEAGYAEWATVGTGYLNDALMAMRASFTEARAAAKSGGGAILFVDEVDSFVSRENLVGGRNDGWWSALTNSLLTLTEMGSSAREGVVIIAATNFASRVDPALRRAGRLDTLIELRLPSPADLGRMVRYHLGPDLPDAEVDSLALGMPNATGADAAKWVRDARDLARAQARPLALADLLAQVRPPETRSPAHLRSVALHEAGHAVVAHALGQRRVTTVSMVADATTDGITHLTDLEAHRTREGVETDVVVLLAGRAADEIFAAADTGAGGAGFSDLARATQLVAALRCSFGLGGSLVHRCEPGSVGRLLQDDPALRLAVEEDLARLYAHAQALVASNADAVEAVAKALIDKRLLSGGDVDEVIAASRQPARARGTRH